jgi:hypothetical protein
MPGKKAGWPWSIKRMATFFNLREINDFEDATSRQTSSAKKIPRKVEPKMFPAGRRIVDELTLWMIAKQIENETKNSRSR